MDLDAGKFIRRFLLHVLPDGFHRIRHYGFLANGRRTAKLERCRRLLGASRPEPPAEPDGELNRSRHPAGPDPRRCPCCGGTMLRLALVPRRIDSS